jgi:hypothetical protein
MEASFGALPHRSQAFLSNASTNTDSSTSTTANSTASGDESYGTNAAIVNEQSNNKAAVKLDAMERAKSLMESHLNARTLIQKYKDDNGTTTDISDEGVDTVAAETAQAVVHDQHQHQHGSVDTMNYDHDIDESSLFEEQPAVQHKNTLQSNDYYEDEDDEPAVARKPFQERIRRRRSNDPDMEQEASNRRLTRRRQGISSKTDAANGKKSRGIGRSTSEPTEKLHEIFNKKGLKQAASSNGSEGSKQNNGILKNVAGTPDISATEHSQERSSSKRGKLINGSQLERATSTSLLN